MKRGGTVNIVTHTIELECSVDNIPQYIEADVGALEIGHSLHLSDITLPKGVRALRDGPDAGHHRAAVGLRRRAEGGGCGRSGCGGWLLRLRRLVRLRLLQPVRCARGGAAPAAGAAAPAAGAKAPAGGGDKKK